MIKNAVPICRDPVAPHDRDANSREHPQRPRSPAAAEPADQTLLRHLNDAKQQRCARL
ncbi:hypothetical protein [Kitasatospora sp. NPDC050463]|uniref:hypothetical protein n=1 Tax=Kitasatospora sp. NPDC050463 TaxID=3155786 RepID=UPI0033FF268F